MGFVFPDDVIEEIKSANSVLDVISEYVPLKKSGHNYRGLCPFHSEKTPSFFVNPDKQIFHCFGCGAGGNVYTFLMQYENISFPEAVRQLAARRGISLPAPARGSGRDEGLGKRIVAASEKAADFFCRQLNDSPEGKAALKYLSERGIDKEGLTTFRIGWSPSGWENLRKHLHNNGFNDEILARAGLVIRRKDGVGYYDRFRGRLMFPIANVRGEIVAFGGRILNKTDEPKYINSPESPLYQKGKMLYGLHLAKAKIKEAGYAVVVEGYMDMITAYLNDAGNTIATMGTALTREHLRLLKRYARKVVVIFDSDAAGIEATKRSLEIFLEEDVTANSASLPEGHDPDSLIRKRGVEEFRKALKESSPLMDFFIQKTAEKWKKEGIDGKARAVEEVVPLLSLIDNHVKRSEYIRLTARILDVREEAVISEVKTYSARRRKQVPRSAPSAGVRRRRSHEEEELVRAMLLDRELGLMIREEVPVTAFSDEACRTVAGAVYENMEKSRNTGQPIIPSLENKEAAALMARLIAESGNAENLEKVVSDCLYRMKKSKVQRELKEVQEKIRQAEAASQTEVIDKLLRIKQNIVKM